MKLDAFTKKHTPESKPDPIAEATAASKAAKKATELARKTGRPADHYAAMKAHQAATLATQAAAEHNNGAGPIWKAASNQHAASADSHNTMTRRCPQGKFLPVT